MRPKSIRNSMKNRYTNHVFSKPFLCLHFFTFSIFLQKSSILGTPFEIRWGQKSAPGPRKDPAERVCMVFASRCFPILHCTLPHITFSFVIFLGKCICRSPCYSRRAKRGVLGAADFQMSSKIDQWAPELAPKLLLFFHLFQKSRKSRKHCKTNGF